MLDSYIWFSKQLHRVTHSYQDNSGNEVFDGNTGEMEGQFCESKSGFLDDTSEVGEE